jgi:hypothetical protein
MHTGLSTDSKSFPLTYLARSFTLSMQSGAFLHLVLTLLAVVSRLGSICSEVLEALQSTSNTIRSVQEVLSVCLILCTMNKILIPCRYLKSNGQCMDGTGRTTCRRYQSVKTLALSMRATCLSYQKWRPTIHRQRWELFRSVRIKRVWLCDL